MAQLLTRPKPPRTQRLTPTAWLRTPPGRLARLLAGLLLAGTAFGAIAVWTASSHASAAHAVGIEDNRLALDAQQIYRSLAEADATAANAYLSGGVEPPALRQRYLDDLATAQTALRDATTRAGNSPALAPLTTQISVYAGLVETARADNRVGLPVGAAYLSEASTVMRTQLLPASEKLYSRETSRMYDDQDSAAAFPYPLLALALITLAALGIVQRLLSRETKRTLNAGLLTATGTLAVMALWCLVALGTQHADIGDSRNLGSAQLEELARAEIAALRVHGDESLFLVSGGEDPTYTDDYTAAVRDLQSHLAKAASIRTRAQPEVSAATAASSAWADAHTRLLIANGDGRYTDAVASATNVSAQGTETHFQAVRKALTQAMASDQKALEGAASDAHQDLFLLPYGLAFLTLVLAAGCAVGLGVRIQEFV